MKKFLIILCILFVIAAITVVLLNIKQKREMVGPMFRAVPLDAAIIIDVADYNSLKDGLASNKPFYDGFLSMSFLREIRNELKLVDSLSGNNNVLANILNQQHPLMITGHPYKKDELQFLYYFRVNTSEEFETIDKTIKMSHGIVIGSSRTYESATIQDMVLLGTRNEGFSYSWVKGILIIGRSSILLEDAIRQLGQKDNILSHNGLNEILKTAGKTAFLNVFLNFEQFPRILYQVIHPKYKNECNSFVKFGSWAELDLNIKPDMVILNGFSSVNNKSNGFETIFKNQKPVKFESYLKIPTSASTFIFEGITNLEQYLNDYQNFSGSNQHRDMLQSLIKNYNIDLAGSFRNVFYHEAGVVYMNLPDDTFENNAYCLVSVKSNEEAENMLNNIVGNYAEKENIKTSELVTSGIYYLPFGNIPYLVFGDLFNTGDNHYCTIADNCLIFGRTREAVRNYLNNLATGKIISNDMEFNNLTEYFSSQSNFIFYNKPGNSADFFNNFLKRELLTDFKNNNSDINSVNSVVYQFNIGENGLIYNNVLLKFKSGITHLQTGASWETKLEGAPATRPFFLKNNHDTAEDIIVQDKKNQLYLISGKGIPEWKINLPEPVISDFYQIDYYRNGKLQIIFNTPGQVYLIDRHGKNVGDYPVSLKVKASNGLAVFDYEKKREYRIFLATADRKINCLDKYFKPVTGWTCANTDTIVRQPVQFFKIENKDYLAFNDSHRIYIVDRKGKSTLKNVQKFNISALNKVSIVNSKSLKEAKFVITDTTGKIIYTAMDGKTNTVDYGVFPANHWFDMVDIKNDGSRDFIYSYNKTVKALTQKGKEIFTITTDKDITYRPLFYELKNSRFIIGIVTSSDGNIALYKNNGEIVKGFPVKGNTPFSVKQNKKSENIINLIVGNESNFILRYTIKLE